MVFQIATDGVSTYMAYETQKFLSNYGVRHRVSSVAYPHSNQRAELAVKSMKRLCRENTSQDGSLNNDRFLRAVMCYRNAPDRDTGRSPAQVIFGRNLRDFLPAPLRRYKPQPQWLMLREDREKALPKRALHNTERLAVGTKQLRALLCRYMTQCKSRTKWGTIPLDGISLE
jgi:transposase InsO family protein